MLQLCGQDCIVASGPCPHFTSHGHLERQQVVLISFLSRVHMATEVHSNHQDMCTCFGVQSAAAQEQFTATL